MAEETSNGPVSAAEPPKANPLAASAIKPAGTLQMKPVIRKPAIGGALKPGLKLPPKPAGSAPLKTVTTASPLKPGLKMPATPTLKAGLKLPTKPVIRKPGSAPAPSLLKPAAPAAAAPAPAPTPAPAPAPAAAPVAAPVVAKTVAAPVVAKPVAAPAVAKPIAAEAPAGALNALKAVTQNLKAVTQNLNGAAPATQQAVLHKTGIIADPAKEMTEAQKQAAKSKTARISLSEAVGVAPVKNENAPMKTIRIKRPTDLQAGGPAKPAVAPVAAPAVAPVAAPAAPAEKTEDASVTQRKTLKITRPSAGVVRPAGKFGIKKPAAPSAAPAAPAAATPAAATAPAADVADIPDIPDIPAVAPLSPVGAAGDTVSDVPAIVGVISVIAQAAACVVIGALAWFLYQDAQVPLF